MKELKNREDLCAPPPIASEAQPAATGDTRQEAKALTGFLRVRRTIKAGSRNALIASQINPPALYVGGFLMNSRARITRGFDPVP